MNRLDEDGRVFDCGVSCLLGSQVPLSKDAGEDRVNLISNDTFLLARERMQAVDVGCTLYFTLTAIGGLGPRRI